MTEPWPTLIPLALATAALPAQIAITVILLKALAAFGFGPGA